MIVRCKTGAQIVIGEMPWHGAAYLSVGNLKGGASAVVDAKALGRLIDELARIQRLLADRAATKHRKRTRKAA